MVTVWCGIHDGTLRPLVHFAGDNECWEIPEHAQGIRPSHCIAGEDANDVYFMEDYAPAHFALTTRAWLAHAFPERDIGHRGNIEWPAKKSRLNVSGLVPLGVP